MTIPTVVAGLDLTTLSTATLNELADAARLTAIGRVCRAFLSGSLCCHLPNGHTEPHEAPMSATVGNGGPRITARVLWEDS